MASTGILNTKDLVIFIDGVALACAQDASIQYVNSTREILCKDSNGVKDFEYGIGEWSGSASGLLAFDAPAGSGGVDMMDLAIAKTKVVLKFSTDEVGDPAYSGTALITQVSMDSSGVGDNATYSVEFQGSGVLDKTVNS